jgi:hypothetical protein
VSIILRDCPYKNRKELADDYRNQKNKKVRNLFGYAKSLLFYSLIKKNGKKYWPVHRYQMMLIIFMTMRGLLRA